MVKVRSTVQGLPEKPRLSVYRSNKYIYAQVIDDVSGKTLASFSNLNLKGKAKVTKAQAAFEVGKSLAELAKKNGISKVVFDRGGYKFHGRVKSLAEGAREGGLKF